MKVKELIKELKMLPKHIEVTFSDYKRNDNDGEQLLISASGVELTETGDGDQVVVIFRSSGRKTVCDVPDKK